ncbi:hypothetical protein [Stieleria varia]|uniref:FlgN protein n=1 Tax=Stieleria varia TaxID=2528005 RepID=A0A5C6ASX0_9BACT|nr:hypothetical protein [Stieleria varia]TWU02379.1 hypothetical protein Pla52n_34290 [Stieleria varia]
MQTATNRKMIVLIQRHLSREADLATSLNELNTRTRELLGRCGLHGPTESEIHALEPLFNNLRTISAEVGESRKRVLAQIRQETGDDTTSLREFIETLPPDDRDRLDESRQNLIKITSASQSEMIQIQASLFYTYDFHRRYLSGILQSDSNGNQYGPTGTSVEPHPGNLYKRTC